MGEWIERADWAKCDPEFGPLYDNLKVEVRFNDGSEDGGDAEYFYWADDGDDCDIAAYRLAEAQI